MTLYNWANNLSNKVEGATQSLASKQASQKVTPESMVSHKVNHSLREVGLILIGTLAIFLLLALYSFHPLDPGWSHSGTRKEIFNFGGQTGAWLADLLLYLFGLMAYLLPMLVGYFAWLTYRDKSFVQGEHQVVPTVMKVVGFLLLMLSGSGLAHLHFTAGVGLLPEANHPGGVLGHMVSEQSFALLFGGLGATLLLLALFMTSITLFSGLSWIWLMDVTGGLTLDLLGRIRGVWWSIRDRIDAYKEAQKREERVEKQHKKAVKRKPPRIEPVINTPKKETVREKKERQQTLFDSDVDEELPPLSLLDEPPESRKPVAHEALEAISKLLEMKLQDFNIEVAVESVHPGPIITRFEIQPAAGVKVSQIVNLSKDLARSLSTMSVRVVEVIPGKTTIGIEIPNENREMIYLSETLRSEAYEKSKSPLTMALGKDIGGQPMVADLAKMPHLLVAGTTGSGKSVAVNAMILSILYTATPKEVRMIMVDPKMLELSIYDGIPHLLSPVVTDMKDASNALRWAVAEMERRYKLMAAMGVRNLTGYNKKMKDALAKGEPIEDPFFVPNPLAEEPEVTPTLDTLPYIVIVVDELADMMMVVGKKVEELIARLAQKARACGIHLILATQRPSVDVLTGLIKANIPTRIAFQVSSKVDSRTILDQMGAEALLGHGDMLYLPPGRAVPERIHGAFVDDHEVHRVVDNLKRRGTPEYVDEIINGIEETEGGAFPGDPMAIDSEQDALYDQAVQIVTDTRKASVSGIQRRLKIGYNRAARMVEAMEAAGVVSALQSNGQREVLAPPPPK